MRRQARLFNGTKTAFLLALFLLLGVKEGLAEKSGSPYSKRDSALYRDVFDQNIYYEGTQYLHLERLYRDLFGKRRRATNVNVFDEVPDSLFFTNRHGRERMSGGELKRGPAKEDRISSGGKWTITKGKFTGITPGFFAKNELGERFVLKFDPMDFPEAATGAEVVASRFLHAMGYNVPEYQLLYLKKDQFEIAPGARVYDESGFQKDLTPERLEEFLLFAPEAREETYRISASRILEGEILGPMKFQGRRKDDPQDLIDHGDRREIRALQVFSAWLNNNDVRESNTLDVVERADGKEQIRHYLIDFNSTLGATPRGAKPPMFGHEHVFDYGETLKAFLSLGFWKKPWQKRWEEAGEEVGSPSVGYFDNRHFNPARYKPQLPYFPFKDLTRADGFWAAKTLMKFTDEDIRDIVSAGDYSEGKTEDELVQILSERRDLIGRFWFEKANPLDEFQLFETGGGSYELRFEDLAVRHGFEAAGESVYRFTVIGKNGKRGVRLGREETREKVFKINAEWLREYPSLDLLIRTQRPGEKTESPYIRLELESEGNSTRLVGIFHQD